jgi:hypothetical protein
VRCWSCGKKIPDEAKNCRFCEAPAEPVPTEAEQQIVEELLDHMPPEAWGELQSALQECETGEEFVNRIMIGACPKCGSDETGDCDSDPEIGELLVGRCYRCGQLWCTECLKLLTPQAPTCECWDEWDDEEWGEDPWEEEEREEP